MRGTIIMALVAVTIGWCGGGAAMAQQASVVQTPVQPTVTQEFSALARVNMAGSQITDTRDGIAIALALSQGVPWRIFTLDDPARAVLDFREVDWSGVEKTALLNADSAKDARFGGFRPGWSRLVIDMARPMALNRAAMVVDPVTGTARLEATFTSVNAERFAALSGMPDEDPAWARPPPVVFPDHGDRRGEGGPLIVVLDPGHGGIDPGAEREGVAEKDLMLSLAFELKEALERAGGTEVVLTRVDDSFVSLERRVEIAHEAEAHLFLSLHADVVTEGRARGAVVHVLSEEATDAASAKLAERHDRDDLLSGVDLTGKDDVVADVLLDLARVETRPRTARLAQALVDGIRASGAPLNSHPLRGAGFSVLKAADIPSVLVEIGFLSDARDRANIIDPAFRAKLVGAIRDAIAAWVIEDAALARLVRQ